MLVAPCSPEPRGLRLSLVRECEMRAEDRIFLAQYASSICLTHPIAALALHRAAVDADEVAVVTESQMHQVSREQAEAKAAEGGTAALVQTYVVARLLAQLAAAIEDCGAIGDAVRYRDRQGLFRRYMRSKNGAVGVFWDNALLGKPITELLAFPDLEGLSMSGEHRQHLAYDYQELPKSLAEIAGIYRGKSSPGAWSLPGAAPAQEPNVVNIVVDIVPGKRGQAPPVPGVSILEAYNKLKHRFTVFGPIASFAAAVEVHGDLVVDATYPREPAYANRLVENICTVARVSGEIAALALRLDQLGVLPQGV